jgi:hypothetical protein
MNVAESRRVSIDELEAILQRDDSEAIEILPNGEIRRVSGGGERPPKPLTMRENLGGEYAVTWRAPRFTRPI